MTDLEKQQLDWYKNKVFELQKECSDLHDEIDKLKVKNDNLLKRYNELNNYNSDIVNKYYKLLER